MDARLWPTLADAIAMLDGRGIRCAVIGGLAVSLRGLPRMTVDVDLVIQAGIDDCLRMARDLTSSPFMPLFEGVEEVVSSAFILPVRHRVTGVRVDLAIGMSGFERDSISRATPVMVGSETIPVVSVEDLLVMKAVAGRPQDDSDIRGLIDVQRDSIDWDHCLGTARALGAAIDVDIAGRLEAARRM